MLGYPATDAIPLSAPVGLFKLLHILLLALHFVAVQAMVGGLFLVAAWHVRGRGGHNPAATAAARWVARTLPVLMTYLMNLGVPPLLFAQALYGHLLYTSSVLIGAHWISVVVLLTVMYWLLYVVSDRAASGRTLWAGALVSLFIAMWVARIYSTNMSLMLRPELWPGLYSADPHGATIPVGDPLITARWLFMLAGALTTAGLALLVMAGGRRQDAALRALLLRDGGALATVGAAAQLGLAQRVVAHVAPAVRAALAESAPYHAAGVAWLVLAGLVAALGLTSAVSARRLAATPHRPLAWGAGLLAVLASVAMTAWRDGLRDLTLAAKGFDVWQHTAVVVNPGLVATFLALVVGGLALVGWMIAVAVKADPVEEAIAP